MNLKEKLINTLGWFGYIIFYSIVILVAVFPVSIVSNYYSWPTWIYFLVGFAAIKIDIISFVFWIIGLIVTINGPQDTLAIVYYIAFAVVNLSFYLISFIAWIISLFKKDKNYFEE